jgi:hypothetical protein
MAASGVVEQDALLRSDLFDVLRVRHDVFGVNRT